MIYWASNESDTIMPLYNDNLIQGIIGNIYQIPDFKIGNYTFAQILDYLPGFGQDQNWDVVKLILTIVSVLLGILFVVVVIKKKKLATIKINWAKEPLPPPSATSGSNARWDEIEKHINSTREA